MIWIWRTMTHVVVLEIHRRKVFEDVEIVEIHWECSFAIDLCIPWFIWRWTSYQRLTRFAFLFELDVGYVIVQMSSSLWYCSPSTVIGRKLLSFFCTWSTKEQLRLWLLGTPCHTVIVDKAICLVFVCLGDSHTFLKICTKTTNNNGPVKRPMPLYAKGIWSNCSFIAFFTCREFFGWFWGFQMAKHVPKKAQNYIDQGTDNVQKHSVMFEITYTGQYSMLD